MGEGRRGVRLRRLGREQGAQARVAAARGAPARRPHDPHRRRPRHELGARRGALRARPGSAHGARARGPARGRARARPARAAARVRGHDPPHPHEGAHDRGPALAARCATAAGGRRTCCPRAAPTRSGCSATWRRASSWPSRWRRVRCPSPRTWLLAMGSGGQRRGPGARPPAGRHAHARGRRAGHARPARRPELAGAPRRQGAGAAVAGAARSCPPLRRGRRT